MNGRKTKGQAGDDKDFSVTIESFKCPITLEYFKDPVIAADGHTYEKQAILSWLRTHNTSPITSQKLTSKLLTINWALKKSMEETFDKLHEKELELAQVRTELLEERTRCSWWDLCFFRKQPVPVDGEEKKFVNRNSCV